MSEQQRTRCDFCGYEIPASVTPISSESPQFCSSACQEAHTEGVDPFVERLSFKQRPIGVAALETALPMGIPGYATVLLSGAEGTRLEAILLEIIWRALERGEPAIIAPIDKPPTIIVDAFSRTDGMSFPTWTKEHYRLSICIRNGFRKGSGFVSLEFYE